MKLKYLLGVGLLCSLTLFSCKEKEDAPSSVTDLSLNQSELILAVGETYTLTAIVTPSDAAADIQWESSKEKVVTVENGVLKAIKEGSAKITVSCGDMTAKCTVEVLEKPSNGDYLYANGKWGSAVNDNVVGVIFYTGDPTADDPTLKADHPNCTHGIACATQLQCVTYWQEKCDEWNIALGGTTSKSAVDENGKNLAYLGTWAGNNGFVDGTVTYSYSAGIESLDAPILGYNNTCAMYAFNADPANAEWPINVADSLTAYRARVQVAATTSGWYIPSIMDYVALLGGSKTAIEGSSDNVAKMNEILGAVTGASSLGSHWDEIINGVACDGCGSYMITSSECTGGWWETIIYTTESRIEFDYDDAYYKNEDGEKAMRPFIAF